MTTDEIIQLSPESIREIIRLRQEKHAGFEGRERRHAPRWPFPGTAELRPVDEQSTDRWFASCRDLSDTGLGLSCERFFEPGTQLEISVHLPEATLYGKVAVRYCMKTSRGFMTGVEFCFDNT